MTKTKKNLWCMTISLVFIPCFLLYNLTLASLPVRDFRLPSQYGTIKEVFEAGGTIPGEDRVIIHIPDTHCNYEAQKNMAELLEYLVKEHSLNLSLWIECKRVLLKGKIKF